jgi:8-oxo-dGTP pyrophosphatase MutT (NUDIX family)
LVFHKKLKMWLQPGGHIEPRDGNLVETARREVREETGLEGLELEEPLFDIDVHRIPAWGQTPAHLHHDVRCLMRAPHLDVRAGDDVSDARWFDLQMVASSNHHLADGFGTDGSVRRIAARLSELNEGRVG